MPEACCLASQSPVCDLGLSQSHGEAAKLARQASQSADDAAKAGMHSAPHALPLGTARRRVATHGFLELKVLFQLSWCRHPQPETATLPWTQLVLAQSRETSPEHRAAHGALHVDRSSRKKAPGVEPLPSACWHRWRCTVQQGLCSQPLLLLRLSRMLRYTAGEYKLLEIQHRGVRHDSQRSFGKRRASSGRMPALPLPATDEAPYLRHHRFERCLRSR
mmetsp:Transcript_61826/g.144791  ORF Transcript_61826/g.144791 Transcript_61826/m.144791 type:complete len:219 (-) Transcript_61826:208-864(-)